MNHGGVISNNCVLELGISNMFWSFQYCTYSYNLTRLIHLLSSLLTARPKLGVSEKSDKMCSAGVSRTGLEIPVLESVLCFYPSNLYLE